MLKDIIIMKVQNGGILFLERFKNISVFWDHTEKRLIVFQTSTY